MQAFFADLLFFFPIRTNAILAILGAEIFRDFQRFEANWTKALKFDTVSEN